MGYFNFIIYLPDFIFLLEYWVVLILFPHFSCSFLFPILLGDPVTKWIWVEIRGGCGLAASCA